MAWKADGTPQGYWTERVGDLLVEVVTSVDHAAFDAFYAAYDVAFTEPTEKEDHAGFRRYLELNDGPLRRQVVDRHGSFACAVMLMHDPRTKVLVGCAEAMVSLIGDDVAIGLNYLFVQPQLQGHGYARQCLEAVRAVAESLFPGQGASAPVLLEIEDPFRCAVLRRSGKPMDMVERLLIWSRLGARLVDIDYVQPALSSSNAPDFGLLLAAIDDRPMLPSEFLEGHLDRFFMVSILKGGDPMENSIARRQLEDLRALPVGHGVALLSMLPVLDMTATAGDLWGGPWDVMPASIRQALDMMSPQTSPMV